MFEKYGCEYPYQNADILDKVFFNSTKKKKYTFPSGKYEFVQGYECLMLDNLLYKENIDEADIVIGVKNVPVINWVDFDNVKRKHFPDIFIKSQNKLIEVKSEWTAREEILPILLYRMLFAKEAGYNYHLVILNGEGNEISTYKI